MSQGFVHCQLNTPTNESITVGVPMTLVCDGDMGGVLKDNAQIHFAKEEDEYKLVVLNVKSASEKNAELIVTSYRPGQHKEVIFNITDGTTQVQSDPLSWAVTSVIKEPKAFPSVGPFDLRYPLWFWAAWGVSLLLVAAAVLYVYVRRQRRKRLMAELEAYNTMSPPFSQFSKDARYNLRTLTQIRAQEEARKVMSKIDEDFRLYLIRELKVPALQYGTGEILRELKKYHRRLYDENHTDLRRVLFELDRAKKQNEKVQAKDCEDLLFLTRTVADKIYATKRRAR